MKLEAKVEGESFSDSEGETPGAFAKAKIDG